MTALKTTMALALALTCIATAVLVRADDAPSGAIPKGVTTEALGNFKVTYYWVTCEDDVQGERDTELTDPKGHSLGKFRAAFVKKLKVEGTGRTLEGKTLNVATGDRYELVKTPWGLGANEKSLEPFRSLAVDPTVIKMGTKILIPEAIGAVLPDGSTHDGVFVAADTGTGIKDRHIDLFCGLERDMKIIQDRNVDVNVPLYKVTRDERKPAPPVALPRAATVRFSKVTVFQEPDTSADAVGTLKQDEVVKVVAKEGAFWKLGDHRWVEGPALDLRSRAQ